MANFSDFSGAEGFFRSRVRRSLRQTIHTASQVFGRGVSDAERQQARKMMLSLVKTILESGGRPLGSADLDIFRQLLSAEHSPFEVERMISELRQREHVSAEEAAPAFLNLPEEERVRLLESLLILAQGTGNAVTSEALLTELAERFGVSLDNFKLMQTAAAASQNRRMRIIRSGAGILVALIVIAVFILTATLLRSVIFGLIGAYLMLPVEKYFERRLRARRGVSYWLIHVGAIFFSPLRNLAARIRKATGTAADLSPADQKVRDDRRLITQAVGLTCALLLLIALLLGGALSGVTGHYVRNLKHSVKNWSVVKTVQENVSVSSANGSDAPSGQMMQFSGQMVDNLRHYLENLRDRFENLPLVRFGLEQLEILLNDENAQRELAGMLLRRTGGLFSFTASVVGMIVAILADLLLTVFFFLLFLTKLAEFCKEGESEGRQSEYLVRTVFNGNWLPGASEETIGEAKRIIGGVISRLRIYVRGYLTLMCVDATIYSTLFFFLDVPYFPLLGVIAGCGILLPYIGPVLSALLTLLVTLAAGGDAVSGFQLAGIILAYLIYNGIIEQFILYPAVIGESLGLTTLETIIVVLLGAVFAGIPGMILALPAASIIKYLVPQIYKCWDSHNQRDVSGGESPR